MFADIHSFSKRRVVIWSLLRIHETKLLAALERFSNDCRKTKTKVTPLRPITTEANSAMNQSEFLEITYSLLEAREKSRVHGAIGFGFASHWSKYWRDSFSQSLSVAMAIA